MPNRPIRNIIRDQQPVVVSPTATVREAVLVMRDRRTGSVMVVEGEALIGIFTERDALVRVLAESLDPDTTAVSAVMTRHPMTIDPDRPVIHALHMMKDGGFRHMPVTADGRPLGMVSIRDAVGLELVMLEQDLERKEQIAEILA